MTLASGTKLGRYEIRSKIGEGGMGEVYLAQDTKLDRNVALKILPAEVAANQERMRRFVQEAKAASALNHPNIITIYEIEQIDSVNFIAIEFVDGETLRQRILNAPLKLGEVLDVAAQIASALSAAHAAGIVHRDIKPENAMLRRDGIVKVLDFGLAKLTAPQQTAVDTEAATKTLFKTDPGIVMGTATYMSPEQARGLEVDARTDIFSFGVVVYEMVAGRLPFEGATTSEVLSAILNEKEPPPLARFARDVPRELEHIVSKALRKDREERYQTVRDMLIDLKDLRRDLELQAQLERSAPPELRDRPTASRNSEPAIAETEQMQAVQTGADAMARTTSSAEYIVSQIKSHKRGAAITLAVLVLASVAAYFYFNRKPPLTDKDTILLADFVNTTGDAVLDGTLKTALALQLEQSPFLNFFSDERVRETLAYMGRSPDERLTKEIAREICERQGLKALLAGSVSNLGSHYVITLEAINAQTGEVLARQQDEAESKELLLRTLGQAATKLREKLGESLTSIQKFDAPIEQATTTSLEALKAYSLAWKANLGGNYAESIKLANRAVELDPNFALAYILLATNYFIIGEQPELAIQFANKAFELRGRVGELERLEIDSWHYMFVTGEHDKATEVLETMTRTYPRFAPAHNNLANQYVFTGQYEKAIAEYREALRLYPIAITYYNVAITFMILNRFAEAKETYQQALARKLDIARYHDSLYAIAFITGDSAEMKQQIDWARARPGEFSHLGWQAATAAFAGQGRQARAFSIQAFDAAAGRNLKEVAATYTIDQALADAVWGDCARTKEEVAKGVALRDIGGWYGWAAQALGECNDVGPAKALWDEFAKRYPKDTMMKTLWLPILRARISLHSNHAAEALDALAGAGVKQSDAIAQFWPQYLRGQADLKLGKGAEAAAEFQTILDHRGWAPLSPLYPLAHLGLARAAVLSGDTSKARKEYQDFFALWKDADPDIPILIEAKKEYEKVK